MENMVKKEELKRFTLRMSPELHKSVRIRAAEEEVSLQTYLLNLVKNDLKKNANK
ncbi:MAG: toxin-antitoxin system HicB family antitoxin [Cetobacterium sp.]|uniref:toxin-antitoxin system HicB family antitoxin n=1 Tax=Cetobacterium sp. TaxID=2071632 RepID=UPI003F2ABA25